MSRMTDSDYIHAVLCEMLEVLERIDDKLNAIVPVADASEFHLSSDTKTQEARAEYTNEDLTQWTKF